MRKKLFKANRKKNISKINRLRKTNSIPKDNQDNQVNGHQYVDLGLSVKWATCNVGAKSPEKCGGYFAWGETRQKSTYSLKTYKWHDALRQKFTKYCQDSRFGDIDNKTVLDPEDDVAHVKWGANWHIPTEAEMDELVENCIWTFTGVNGVGGYRATSKLNGNSIFLPCAGYRCDSKRSCRTWYGKYWTSTSYDHDRAVYLDFDHMYELNCLRDDGVDIGEEGRVNGPYGWGEPRCWGLTIRPVCQ